MSNASPYRGRLLVASPVLADPNFSRTVVLMLEHSDEGALGVVLNRPTGVPITDPLPAWVGVADEPAEFFRGGPVGESSVIGLARLAPGVHVGEPDGFTPVPGLLVVGAVDLSRDPEAVRPPIAGARLFLGYSGWEAGQLESECDEASWFVLDAEPDDVFSADPAGLWSLVMLREGGRYAIYANCPPDPSVN